LKNWCSKFAVCNNTAENTKSVFLIFSSKGREREREGERETKRERERERERER
jgi:hypothetical protein